MNIRILIYTYIILLFSINLAHSQVYDFDVWAVRSGLFTIGKSEILQIYIKNIGFNSDSYTISYSKYATKQTQDVSHLLNVNFESNEISNVEPDEVGSTVATVVILGPIDDGMITFTATSVNSPSLNKQYTLSNIRVGYPIALSEFSFIGLFLFLVGLVYFKRTII